MTDKVTIPALLHEAQQTGHDLPRSASALVLKRFRPYSRFLMLP